jgi:hypothetical protein
LQHTSTHSTRLVALTSSDTTKRTKCTQQTTAVPLPIPAHALIKIEDGINNIQHSHHHHHHNHHQHQSTASIFEQDKSIQTASIANPVQNPTEISGQIFYQHPGLIQIAPQPQPPSSVTAHLESSECRHPSSPPPLQLTTGLSANHSVSHSTSLNSSQLNNLLPGACPPDVQDANIQTSPIMSEDDNSTGHECMAGTSTMGYDEESRDQESACRKLNASVMETEPELTETELTEHRKSVPDTSVTSSSVVSIKQQLESPETFENEANEMKQTVQSPMEEQREPVDLSGLQLLSNSIDVFHKKVIKQEPLDQLQITSPTIASTTVTPPIEEEKPLIEIPRASIPEDLGGLNLLCALAEQALAEQRLEENSRIPSPASNDNLDHQIKKRKHKLKSSKKSKHNKQERKAKKRKHSTIEEEKQEGELKDEIAASLKRVKTKFENLPITSVDDVFRLMENDMKEKLANITRQCEEKRRELKQIKTSDATTSFEKDSIFSASSNDHSKQTKEPYSSSTPPLEFSIIPALSPSFSSSSNSESIVDIPKLSSDTDSGSKDDGEDCSNTERSKRKFSIPNKNNGDKQGTETIVAKKSKSFVGYILASSKQHKLSNSTPQTIDSWTSSIKNGKASLPFLKQEDQDGRGILKESAFKDERVFSIFGDGNHQKFQASSPITIPTVSRHKQPSIKHHSKHKKHKERRRHRERQRIDSRVKLNSDHLKQAKTRVLMAQGGLFYAGTLSPVEPSEIFAISLDGERGNRPHIMPRDEILKQVVCYFFFYFF